MGKDRKLDAALK